MGINFKIYAYFAMVAACCILFAGYIWFASKSIALLTAGVVLCAVITALSIILIYVLKKHMEQVLGRLSQVISNIIDMKEEEVFSVLNDDMLSKLQSQVIKLTGILRAQNERIKGERDEVKSLISDISHQLKTPLSNLKLYYELLQDTAVSEDEYREFSLNMQSQIEKLSFLLEGMIKMSRLEGGIIRLNPRETSLNDICLTAIKQVHQKARSKNIEIKFNPGRDIVLNIDKSWTVEAVFNLIDNAVKYTDPFGTIIIDALYYEMFARVDVIDNGRGIDEGEINNIFKRFYRGKEAQDQEGLGLGLYLAREIITRQSGYMKVKSKPGQGSVFSVFLPLN